eukprot:3509311-Amphidinium_carterae.1
MSALHHISDYQCANALVPGLQSEFCVPTLLRLSPVDTALKSHSITVVPCPILASMCEFACPGNLELTIQTV